MKLNQEAKTFETNADFTSQDFSIGDVSVVIEILRNKLYRHKVRTLVQEYISNARDAQREVGQTRQIEITLPTMFDSTFKVRDFGPGISPDRMYNVFIKYASSTKRKDNVQTGGFGIGAKSAWSYTESFTIVTHIDGVQRTYIAHIGANNNGRLDFMGEDKSTEANGTEIQIPVSPKDISEFKRSAFRAVHFWTANEKPLFKNVQASEIPAYQEGERIGNIEVAKDVPDFIMSSYDKGMIVAIDGIPYVAGSKFGDKLESFRELSEQMNGRLILHLNNGDLEVSASREEISDSKATIDGLDAHSKATLKVIHARIAKEFSKATTPFEHLTVFMQLKKVYRLEKYRKIGDFFVSDREGIESELFRSEHIKMERCAIVAPKMDLVKEHQNKSGRYSWSRKATLTPDLLNSLYFTDGTETALIVNYRLKALLGGSSTKSVILFTAVPNKDAEFKKVIQGLGAKDLKTVAYTKPVRKTREAQQIERTKEEFCIHDQSRWSNKATYITLEQNTQKWLYVSKQDSLEKNYTELSQYLQKRGFKIAALSDQAMRLVKGDANFTPLVEFLNPKKFTLDKTDINSLKLKAAKHRNTADRLSKLDGLKDKTLVKLLAEYKDLPTGNLHHEIPQEILTLVGTVPEVERFKANDKALGDLLSTKYSLLERISWPHHGKDIAEIVLYMNAK